MNRLAAPRQRCNTPRECILADFGVRGIVTYIDTFEMYFRNASKKELAAELREICERRIELADALFWYRSRKGEWRRSWGVRACVNQPNRELLEWGWRV